MGSNFKLCQLKFITYPKRIIISHFLNQLVYGGQSFIKTDTAFGNNPVLVTVGGVVGVLQKKFVWAGKMLEKINGKIIFFKGGFVGWLSDMKTTKLKPIGTSDAIYPFSQDEIFKSKFENVLKRSEIEVDKKQKIPSIIKKIGKRTTILLYLFQLLSVKLQFSESVQFDQ
ncbi:hypothetical protein MXB_2658 [Myxobolus squamalis]|nr:hypothetical protein MXB_2658 [Myxobolus squamalis]